MKFLQDVAKEIGNEYAALVSDGVAAGDTSGYIDTGSHIFNALVSGSIYGGVPSNKIMLSRVSLALARLSFALGLSSTFWSLIPTQG